MGGLFQNINLTDGKMLATYSGISDPDAQAFITATGITGINASAIDTLVIALKSANIWTKMKAIYPMIGGTATTHKFNLKDSRDLDAAFRLFFSGGGTHSANGYQPGGVNGYANTFLTPSTTLSLNSTHLSYYSRTDVNLTQVEIGNQSVSAYLIIEIRTANNSYYIVNTNSYGAAADTNSAAFYIANRTASNINNGFRNSIKTYNTAATSTSLPTNTIYIGAMQTNANVPQYYTTKECAFASIGDGLSDVEALSFYNAVQTFNTTLGRQV